MRDVNGRNGTVMWIGEKIDLQTFFTEGAHIMNPQLNIVTVISSNNGHRNSIYNSLVKHEFDLKI